MTAPPNTRVADTMRNPPFLVNLLHLQVKDPYYSMKSAHVAPTNRKVSVRPEVLHVRRFPVSRQSKLSWTLWLGNAFSCFPAMYPSQDISIDAPNMT